MHTPNYNHQPLETYFRDILTPVELAESLERMLMYQVYYHCREAMDTLTLESDYLAIYDLKETLRKLTGQQDNGNQ
mgnify:CR=1 FL=1